MSFHIEIIANDAQRTVVYSGDVEDFDLTEGTPLKIAARTAKFSGEGTLSGKARGLFRRRGGRRRK